MIPVDQGTRRLILTQIHKITWLHEPTWIKNEERLPKKVMIKKSWSGEIIEETFFKLTIFESLANWARFTNFKRTQNKIVYVLRTVRKEESKLFSITAEA